MTNDVLVEVEAEALVPPWTDAPLSDEVYDALMARLRRRGATYRPGDLANPRPKKRRRVTTVDGVAAKNGESDLPFYPSHSLTERGASVASL